MCIYLDVFSTGRREQVVYKEKQTVGFLQEKESLRGQTVTKKLTCDFGWGESSKNPHLLPNAQ